MDFADRDKCKPVLLRLSLAGNLEIALMSLYGTEWREHDAYAIHIVALAAYFKYIVQLQPSLLIDRTLHTWK